MPRLKMLTADQYRGVLPEEDPIRFYYYPVFGQLYRRRVELCLAECRGGRRVLEIGCGSGVAFLNLNEIYEEIHGLDLTADLSQVQAVFEPLGIHPLLKQGNVLDMPYADNSFDTVLLVSILEHLQAADQDRAFREIARVLKPGGQVVYGTPVERPFMVFMFWVLGYDIRQSHFSTEKQIAAAAGKYLQQERTAQLRSALPGVGAIYQVGHYLKPLG
ncbi:MAG: class I SAM-dependent methyltransferase [Anaerolineales bacterium]|nr:class I SAM-dependent methyltransferase [Anaerolineales bacterium]